MTYDPLQFLIRPGGADLLAKLRQARMTDRGLQYADDVRKGFSRGHGASLDTDVLERPIQLLPFRT